MSHTYVKTMEVEEAPTTVITIDNDIPSIIDTRLNVDNASSISDSTVGELGPDSGLTEITEDLTKLNIREKLLREPYYPSPGIEQLFLDAAAVTEKLMDQAVFDKKYKVETEFYDIGLVYFLVDFYKVNRIALTTTKEVLVPVLEELNAICVENKFDFTKCLNFVRWLEFRRQKQCHTFLAFTKLPSYCNDRTEQEKGYFDLDEHPDQYKRKTILECGLCKKLESLQLCARCNTAAYCCRECQKKDYSFHKRYCKAKEGYVEKCNKK